MYKHTVLPWIIAALQVATILLAMVSEKYNYMVTKISIKRANWQPKIKKKRN